MSQQKKLTIIVVEKSRLRANEVFDALNDGGLANVTVIADESVIARKVDEINPDVVLIDLHNPGRDSLRSLSEAAGAKLRPVAMFVDQSDPELIHAAINAGLSAYVVGGLERHRIRPILEAAIARFRVTSQMRSELEAAKSALAARKTIDQAKGLLIQAKGLTEDEAYQLIRKTAMDQGRRMIDVAQALITASKLLG